MKKLKEVFRKSFGVELEEIIPFPEGLLAIDSKNCDEALLFASSIAKETKHGLYFVQADIGSFLKSCPRGYFMVGFWGYGINSYAFYYVRVDSMSKVFFRLPYGGVYMNNDQMALLVKNFLTNFLIFEKRLIGAVKSFVAVESMGVGYYTFLLRNKRKIELKESLFRDGDFDGRLGKLLW